MTTFFDIVVPIIMLIIELVIVMELIIVIEPLIVTIGSWLPIGKIVVNVELLKFICIDYEIHFDNSWFTLNLGHIIVN